ncbi:MAG: ATP-dependent sacrificial sulfur transferase LarE [Desulfobulbaceae bacterium]|nr:ATP-dependent sacrificial sulfur transferase LarE [Desulfobulbaceae bacterium]HIJ90046.1 ATP-dependent sacrificial sulfur transferase LarE [Deltaproteobacteria bacterium]
MSAKYRQLQEIISQYKKVAIAFSGGVDSSFLLYAACTTLGPSSVHAFHARSELLPSSEVERVELAVKERGCFFHPIAINPLVWSEFVANGAERCYHCKKKIYQTFLAEMPVLEGALLFDGTNRDDLGQDRPGLMAVAELNVQTPLADLGFTKKEIRLLSREFSLSTWDAHASSCLATRIAQREPITREKILLVAQCEALLQKKGFMGVRVRLSQGNATIAVLKQDLCEIRKKNVFPSIKHEFSCLGLRTVTIDPQGR